MEINVKIKKSSESEQCHQSRYFYSKQIVDKRVRRILQQLSLFAHSVASCELRPRLAKFLVNSPAVIAANYPRGQGA